MQTGSATAKVALSLIVWEWGWGESTCLAFTQYCRYQYGIVYSIQKEGRGRGIPCEVVVQYFCNSVGITAGGGTIKG